MLIKDVHFKLAILLTLMTSLWSVITYFSTNILLFTGLSLLNGLIIMLQYLAAEHSIKQVAVGKNLKAWYFIKDRT